MQKKIKVAYLLDNSNDWIKKYIKKFKYLKKSKKYNSKIFTNYRKIKNYDIVFVISYTKILKSSFLKKNKLTLVVHASNLPKGKGFSPIQWQILEKKNEINFCLLRAATKVDSGEIYEKDFISLDGTELYDKIRYFQAIATMKIIYRFLKKYPNVISIQQNGKSTFYRRRTKKDSILNINLPIKKLFNQMRIANNEKWPSFFIYKKKKYVIKIFEDNVQDRKKNHF